MTDVINHKDKDKDILDAFLLVCSHTKELRHLYEQESNKEWELAFLIFSAGVANASHLLGEGYNIPCSCGNPLHALHITPPVVNSSSLMNLPYFKTIGKK
jgi:hypothetical protein